MKSIYLLLTKTQTLASRLIHAATGDGFTHVSIALDRELTTLSSFARKHEAIPLPAGHVRENVHTATLGRNPDAPCALYRLDVTDTQYEAIKAGIAAVSQAKTPYRYSILGMLLCRLDIAHERKHHMFCSQFVARVLNDAGAVRIPKAPSLMRPADFAALPGLVCCYEGPLAWCDSRRPPHGVHNAGEACILWHGR